MARQAAPQLLLGCKSGDVTACQKLQGFCDVGPAAAALLASVQTQGFSGAPTIRSVAVQQAAREHRHSGGREVDPQVDAVRRVYCTALRMARGLPPQGIRSAAGLKAAQHLGRESGNSGGEASRVLIDTMSEAGARAGRDALTQEMQPWKS